MSLDYGLLRSDTLLKQGCKIIEGVLKSLTTQGKYLCPLFCGSRPCKIQKLMRGTAVSEAREG